MLARWVSYCVGHSSQQPSGVDYHVVQRRVMSEAATKKVTVRTLATEINVSHETLISFLQKKGFTSVKTIMSKIEPEALDAVMKQFGKDKEVAEKRQKKLSAFKEQRAKTREDYLGEHPDRKAEEEPQPLAAEPK